MTIQVRCPGCEEEYRLRDDFAGKTCKCKSCGGNIKIPLAQSAATNTPRSSALPSAKSNPPKSAPVAKGPENPASSQTARESARKVSLPKPAVPKPTSPKTLSNPDSRQNPPSRTVPTAAKSLPSKAVTPTPEKLKPKPILKKKIEPEVVEDSFDEIDDFDDLNDDESFDAPAPSRAKKQGKKKKTKSGGLDLSKTFSSIAGIVVTSPLFLVFVACVGVGIAFAMFPREIAPLALVMIWGGGALILVSEIWYIVAMFRVSVGWAVLIILSGVANFGLIANGQPGVGATVNLVGSVLSIMLIFQHWDEFRGPVKSFFAGLLIVLTPVLGGLFGVHREMQKLAEPDPQQRPPSAIASPVLNPAMNRTNPVTPPPTLTPANTSRPGNSPSPQGFPTPVMPNLIPSNPQQASANLQPSGRVVTFRVEKFAGSGDPVAAARQALATVPWADRNDIEFDQQSGELRIGQLGGSVNTQQAKEPLEKAGFQFAPGISVGPKKK